jgi:hypothetical protein
MIAAPERSAARLILGRFGEEALHDRVSDIAGAGWSDCSRAMGGIRMIAEIIRFITRPKHDRQQTDFPAIAFRSTVAENSATDHADVVQRHRVQPDWYEK